MVLQNKVGMQFRLINFIRSLFLFVIFFLVCEIRAEQSSSLMLASIPKCGTHLLVKTYELFVQLKLAPPNPPCYHLYFDTAFNSILNKEGKIICIIRDLRDACISLVPWISYKHPELDLYEEWTKGDVNQKLTLAIKGLSATGIESWDENHSNAIFRSMQVLNMLLDADVNMLVIRFEDLVGIKGNGNNLSQMLTLQKIASFIGVQPSQNELEYIADHLFGETETFDVGLSAGLGGQIGKWREFFTSYHKELFKQIYGDYLIRWGYEENNEW